MEKALKEKAERKLLAAQNRAAKENEPKLANKKVMTLFVHHFVGGMIEQQHTMIILIVRSTRVIIIMNIS